MMKNEDIKKVILVDTSGVLFPSIFSWEMQVKMKQKSQNEDTFIWPAHCLYLISIISSLKKIGVDENTKIIMALEGKSFRKQIYAPYKAQREGDRNKHELIDWDKTFKDVNNLHEQLKECTDWNFVREYDGLEADDVIAVACRYFPNAEKIVVSGDADLKQLAYYDNTYFYNLFRKCKGSKGMFEDIKNPLGIIADKAKKGDVSDNIIPSPDDEEEDFELRYQLVNLLELPDEIEDRGIKAIEKELAREKQVDIAGLPKYIQKRFPQIYNEENKVTPEYCFNLQEKRDKKKKEALKLKREQKKLEKLNNG